MFLLFLRDLNNNLFKIITVTMDLIRLASVCMCLCISEMNYSNDTSHGRKELEIFCYYKVAVLLGKHCGVI